MATMHNDIQKIAERAVVEYSTYKILPSVIIAQAWLETGNGKGSLLVEHNNYFGLKWYDTDVTRDYDKVVVPTWEEINGEKVDINAAFCSFDSPEQSLECLYKWYTMYTKYNVLKCVTDYRVTAQLIQDCGYATDSKYASKLVAIIERENLTAYDIKAHSVIETENSPHYIKIYAGSYTIYSNAVNSLVEIRKKVPTAFIVKADNGNWRVQVGAFIEPKNAENFMQMLSEHNINTFKEG